MLALDLLPGAIIVLSWKGRDLVRPHAKSAPWYLN